jgi:hypothetical protein
MANRQSSQPPSSPADTPLELTTKDSLLVSPVRDKARQQKLLASLGKPNRKFGDDLKRLAE